MINLIAAYTNRLITNPDIRADWDAQSDPVGSSNDVIRDTLINESCAEDYRVLFAQRLGLGGSNAQHFQR